MGKFDWLKYYFENRTYNSWTAVSEIIPNEFDEYHLLHWNVGIVDDFPFDQYPEQNVTIEQTNQRIRIERDHKLFLNSDEDRLFRKTDLKEISDLFNTEYSYQTLNKIKQTPAIKILPEISVKNLRETIRGISENQTLNLYVEDFHRYPNHEMPNQEIENISLSQYFKLQNDVFFDYWSYLFPDDKSWCLTTAEALPMFLCTKNKLAETVLTNTDIEMFKVEYNEKLYQ